MAQIQHAKVCKGTYSGRNDSEAIVREHKSFKLIGKLPDLIRYLPEVFPPEV